MIPLWFIMCNYSRIYILHFQIKNFERQLKKTEWKNINVEQFHIEDHDPSNESIFTPFYHATLPLNKTFAHFMTLKGPKHDQVGCEFFYIKQACMVRWLGDWRKKLFLFFFGEDIRHFVFLANAEHTLKIIKRKHGGRWSKHTAQIFLTWPSVWSCVRHGCNPLEKFTAQRGKHLSDAGWAESPYSFCPGKTPTLHLLY